MSVIHKDPETMGGTPIFKGTRVPLRNLFDYLVKDPALNEFLEDFPGVSRDAAVTALNETYTAFVSKLGEQK